MDEAIKALVTETRQSIGNLNKACNAILWNLRQEWERQVAAEKAAAQPATPEVPAE
jgi:hypothetical protein